MSANAISAQGSKIEVSNAAGGVVFAVIGDVVTFSGFDGQASELDTTDLSSTAKEFALGLVNNGGFTMSFHNAVADPGQIVVKASRDTSTVRTYKLTLPLAAGTPRIATFNAFARQASLQGGVDALIMGSFSLVISGPVVWS